MPEPAFSAPNPRATGLRASDTGVRGKLPPQALEVEQAVLGAILLERDALAKVTDALRAEIFYKPAHQEIFNAAVELFHNGEPVDLHTLTQALRRLGTLQQVGGPVYLAELTQHVASAANVEFHARILVQKFIQRELIQVCSELQLDAYDDTKDVFETLNEAEQKLYGLSGDNLRREAESMKSLGEKVEERLQELAKRKGGLTGISSGYSQLDRLTSGWQKSDLVILAARPGMGKTAFALNLARNAAMDANTPVLLFSLEMGATQLAQRLVAAEAEIDSQRMRTGQLDDYMWTQLHDRVGKLSAAPIYIDDTPGLNVYDLRAKCRRLKADKGIGMVMIDYLQLMSGDGNKNSNREQEISKISRSLKMLAKELDIPVLALSQLSRAVETRSGDKRPMLSDLRESGAIEQDADMVMFLYRPDYYPDAPNPEGVNSQGICEVIIAKQRNGPVDTVQLQFVKEFGKFRDLPAGGYGGYGDFTQSYDYSGSGTGTFMPESGTNITLPSKMNDADEAADLDESFEAPF